MNAATKIINIKWEERSIILGLIYYIVRHYEKMMMKYIYIKEIKIRAFLSFIFKNMDFTDNKDEAEFIVRIKNIKVGNLNINNINNISKISIKKFYILPWYDSDNPLIMWTPGDRVLTRKWLKHNIAKTTLVRNEPHGEPNYITSLSRNIWDSQIEYNILSMYSSLYKLDIYYIYNLLTNFLLYDITGVDKTLISPVINYVKLDNKCEKTETNIKTETSTKTDTPYYKPDNYSTQNYPLGITGSNISPSITPSIIPSIIPNIPPSIPPSITPSIIPSIPPSIPDIKNNYNIIQYPIGITGSINIPTPEIKNNYDIITNPIGPEPITPEPKGPKTSTKDRKQDKKYNISSNSIGITGTANIRNKYNIKSNKIGKTGSIKDNKNIKIGGSEFDLFMEVINNLSNKLLTVNNIINK